MRLDKQTLLQIKGGMSISASMISALVRGIDVIIDVGRSFGSALRRMKDGNMCKY